MECASRSEEKTGRSDRLKVRKKSNSQVDDTRRERLVGLLRNSVRRQGEVDDHDRVPSRSAAAAVARRACGVALSLAALRVKNRARLSGRCRLLRLLLVAADDAVAELALDPRDEASQRAARARRGGGSGAGAVAAARRRAVVGVSASLHVCESTAAGERRRGGALRGRVQRTRTDCSGGARRGRCGAVSVRSDRGSVAVQQRVGRVALYGAARVGHKGEEERAATAPQTAARVR